MNDDLPVKVSHYSWGHDLEVGQGDMRAFIDLSLKNAPHTVKWSKELQSVELGGHISSNQWSIRLAFSYFWFCMTMGTSSWSEHSYLPFWMFVFSSCLKNIFISEKHYLVWIRWCGAHGNFPLLRALLNLLKESLGRSKPATNLRTSTLTNCVGFLLYPSLTEPSSIE